MNARSPSETKAQSLRERMREQTAAAILGAAEEVFAQQGLTTAHMNDIAAKAGVAVGTLYNHFKDRDALLLALLTWRRGQLIERMDEFLDQPSSGDFRTDLTGMVKTMGGFFEQNRRFQDIMHRLEVGLSSGQFPETATCAPEMKKEMHLRLEKLIKRGIKQKALRAELADYYPYLLMGILRSIRIRHVEQGIDGYMPADEVVNFFMKGAGA